MNHHGRSSIPVRCLVAVRRCPSSWQAIHARSQEDERHSSVCRARQVVIKRSQNARPHAHNPLLPPQRARQPLLRPHPPRLHLKRHPPNPRHHPPRRHRVHRHRPNPQHSGGRQRQARSIPCGHAPLDPRGIPLCRCGLQRPSRYCTNHESTVVQTVMDVVRNRPRHRVRQWGAAQRNGQRTRRDDGRNPRSRCLTSHGRYRRNRHERRTPPHRRRLPQ